MNLWHLFPSEATYKLDTFLAGGLWCADLGSIFGFEGDVEGDGPLGLFVSCWHATEGDPTLEAWQIFGEKGDGFAIRTTVEELRSYATSFKSPTLAARMGVVSYVPKGVRITDPALLRMVLSATASCQCIVVGLCAFPMLDRITP